jgi:hypothetical protein
MARPLQALASARKVKIADTEYGHRLLNQLLQFPAGRLDDAVDMATLLPLAIDQANPAVIATPLPPVNRDGYDQWSKSDDGDSWKAA